MIYGSVCSGIEAATAAWHPLGWTPSFFSEIDAFPRAVLKHHYPEVPLHGDFTAIPWRGKPADQCPDGPRYKALGNSMAVPVMAWIGRRIQTVENIKSGLCA